MAKIKCIPTARAIWASLQMYPSISLPLAIIKSASSSIKIKILGICFSSSFLEELYSLIFLHPASDKIAYLLFISETLHLRALAALFGSTITGVSK